MRMQGVEISSQSPTLMYCTMAVTDLEAAAQEAKLSVGVTFASRHSTIDPSKVSHIAGGMHANGV